MSNPDLNIEILGVNQIGASSSNELITSVRLLPWLQDTGDAAVWSGWHVTYRDVYILDSQNRVYATYNLTEHDLSDANNRAFLKQLFLNAANSVDSDRDQLSDDWELRYFGNLSPKGGDDTDGDGIDNFTEFSFDTNPTDAKSHASWTTRIRASGQQDFFSLTFRRRAGGLLDYAIEASPDLKLWSRSTTDVTQQLPVIHFDGAGSSEVTCSLKAPTSAQPSGFLRVKAFPRVQP